MNKVRESISFQKLIIIIMDILFGISLLPLYYLSFFNRASGDDYGFGASNRMVWLETHSILSTLKNAFCYTISIWKSWQGTWFSVFLFSLQPEVFSDKAYVITTFIMLTAYVITTYLLLMEWSYFLFGIEKNVSRCFCIGWVALSIHFVPRPKNVFFGGMAVYTT